MTLLKLTLKSGDLVLMNPTHIGHISPRTGDGMTEVVTTYGNLFVVKETHEELYRKLQGIKPTLLV